MGKYFLRKDFPWSIVDFGQNSVGRLNSQEVKLFKELMDRDEQYLNK